MIIVKQKPLEEIFKSIRDSKRILVVGCDGCVGVHQAGGMRQAELMSNLLEMAAKHQGSTEKKIDATTVLRQCDRQIVKTAFRQVIDDYDTILSMACGVGVQTMADVFDKKVVIPATDTMFIGMQDFEGEKFYEFCSACGDCVLAETGGICPITRCAKHLLNGPCGGFAKGKCEIGEGKRDCAWVLIFNRLKERGRLDLFTKFRPPRDYRASHSPRELKLEV